MIFLLSLKDGMASLANMSERVDAQILACASSTMSACLQVIYLQQHLAPFTKKLEDSFEGRWTSKSKSA